MSVRLNYACPRTDTNMCYWCGGSYSSTFFVWEVDGKLFAMSNILDRPQLQKSGKFEKIFVPTDISKNFNFIKLCKFILKKHKQECIHIPWEFPAGLVEQLQKHKINFKIIAGEFLPEREFKSAQEKLYIKEVCDVIAKMYNRVIEILHTSTIAADKTLKFNRTLVTSEFLKKEIFNIGLRNHVLAEDTIVACGKDSSQPHNQGAGAILANEFIVIDIFPQSLETRYFGDMTRTFIKGTPSDAQYKLYKTVERAQQTAIENLIVDYSFDKVNFLVNEIFTKNGYITDGETGYFHNLGHGLGMELHERPRFSSYNYIQNDMVFTIEPGLYYPEIGGVRIEDDFAITNGHAERLSNFNADWIL